MMPELIDMTDEDAHAACEALAKMLRIVPIKLTEETKENA